MRPRFFCPGLPDAGAEIALPAEVAHHADRVLRLRAGDGVRLFDGEGREADAVLVALGRDARALIERCGQIEREAPLAITLVQALATGDKMDWVVQKAVELGVTRIQPILAERSVLRLDGERAEKRRAHWQQVAVAAAGQCGRNRIADVGPQMTLPQFLATASAVPRWILAPEGAGRLSQQPQPAGGVALLVGPEGGWSEREETAAALAGCVAVSLGPRILRTETAGLAAAAACLALWGDY